MAQDYPVFLKLRNKLCVVVGGGKVAARKAASLLDSGADVRVVSPELTPALRELAAQGRIAWRAGPYSVEALAGAFLVVGATGEAAVNRQVAADCETRGLPVNIVDAPELCSFIVPAVVKRGSLVIAVSTGGASPALSRRIREQLEEQFDESYSVLLAALGEARARVRQNVPDPVRRKEIFAALYEPDLLSVLKQDGTAALFARINEITGGLYA